MLDGPPFVEIFELPGHVREAYDDRIGPMLLALQTPDHLVSNTNLSWSASLQS